MWCRSQRGLSPGTRLIAAPNLRLIDDATVERLQAVCRQQGGTFVLNYRAATQKMDNSMRLTLAPGPFAEIAGVKSVAILDLFEYNSQNNNLDAKLQDAARHRSSLAAIPSSGPRTAIESLIFHGAEAIATVRGGGPMEGTARDHA